MHRILVIDDEESVRDILQSFLQLKGFEVTTASGGKEGINILEQDKFSIILTDLMMPDITGLDILKRAAETNLNTPIILITAYGTIQSAVEAMKMGAFDYVTKPFSLDEILVIINRAIDFQKLQKENTLLKMQLKKKYRFKGLIGNSPQMNKIYELIEKVADTDSTILITGESGTGKEVVAKTIHYNSLRTNGPFIPINCAAIPKDLIETEMFGHEKGAFTGATNTRIGRFELANNGTIFLDEIGELEPSLQVKILRVLQEREFERVGGVKTIKVDVRVIAATNRDLEKAVREGKFREDLFYRLNVIPIHMPPLRKRLEDIPLLMDHFIHEICKKRNRNPLKFSKEAMDCLLEYRWPGNVRELENLIERLSILVSGDIVSISDLPERFIKKCIPDEMESSSCLQEQSVPAITIPQDGMNLNKVVDEVERSLIMQALEKTGWIKSKAANVLGLNRTTLIEKMKKMGIKDKSNT